MLIPMLFLEDYATDFDRGILAGWVKNGVLCKFF